MSAHHLDEYKLRGTTLELTTTQERAAMESAVLELLDDPATWQRFLPIWQRHKRGLAQQVLLANDLKGVTISL